MGSSRGAESVRESHRRLAEAIRLAQRTDPFRRCTVVIPHRAVSLDVMRHAAASGGAVGIRPVTLLDLARELLDEAGALAGRTALTRAALHDAVMAQLAAQPRAFAQVAEQPATVEALVEASLQLARAAHLPAADEAPLPQVTADAIAIHHAAHSALDGAYTAHDLFAEADDLLASDASVRERLGAVLVFRLPPQDDPAAARFADRLAGLAEQVIPPASVDAEQVRERLRHVVSVTDPVEEAQLAVESIAARLCEGTPGHRLGIFFPSEDPYLGIVTAMLQETGIAVTSPGTVSMAALPGPRLLLRLLETDTRAPDLRMLLDGRWEGALNAQDPGSPDTRPPSSAGWERAYVAAMRGELPENSAEEPGAGPSEHDRSGHLRAGWLSLQSVAARLSTLLKAVDTAPTWNDALDAVERLAEALLAAAATPRARHGRAAISRALLDLRRGEGVPAPSRDLLALHLARSLDAMRPRHGSLAQGVVVGTFASAAGRDLDLVHVLGMADGIAPSAASADPILPDAVRARLGGGLLTSSQVRARQRQDFQQTLLAGDETVVSVPRGRLRQAGPLLPSPWLEGAAVSEHVASPLASARDGAPHSLTGTSEKARQSGGIPVAATLGRAWHRRVLRDRATPLPAAAQRAREIRRDREQGLFTRFTGDVSSLRGALDLLERGTDAEGRGMSATALERWAQEPYSYFLERVLGGEIFEYPDEETAINPADFGTLVHAVLEDVARTLLETGELPDDTRAEELLNSRLDAAHRDVWVPAQWEFDRLRARDMLHRELTDLRENADSAQGWRPIAAESAFGVGEHPQHDALRIPLTGGTLHVRGRADRVDARGDGALRVLDYKTGSRTTYEKITAGANADGFDPTLGGTRLQLPIYLLHAIQQLRPPTAGADVEAAYRFLSPNGGEDVALTWSEPLHAELLRQLERITHGMESGMFPVQAAAQPRGARQTWYTLMGQRSAEQLSAALRDDPRVAHALGLPPGPPGDDARPPAAAPGLAPQHDAGRQR